MGSPRCVGEDRCILRRVSRGGAKTRSFRGVILLHAAGKKDAENTGFLLLCVPLTSKLPSVGDAFGETKEP
jgi:hypothetical protein